jgi:peptidoglycan/LPS O-acetylase OafA/YrhL
MIHFVDFYESHTYPIRSNILYQNLHLDSVFGLSSDNGILMFFAISGFILGMPFAKSHLFNEPFPSLRDFYIRRISRLEPPYLLILTILFILNVFVIHRDTLANTFPHYAASFFYLHNILYQSHPTLNFVFWTLEIEIQFYLLAPLFTKIFTVKMANRRVVLLAAMFLFASVNALIKTPFLSLFNYFQYFLAGFLALDLFLHNTFKKSYLFDVVCFLIMFLMYTGIVRHGVLLPFLIVLLIYCSPLSLVWHRLLTLKWVTIIGGMCYSIYMIHQPLMALFLNRVIGNDMIQGSLWTDFFLKFVVVMLLVLFVSTVYFVLIERPCMKKGWYKTLGRKLSPVLSLSRRNDTGLQE